MEAQGAIYILCPARPLSYLDFALDAFESSGEKACKRVTHQHASVCFPSANMLNICAHEARGLSCSWHLEWPFWTYSQPDITMHIVTQCGH